MIIRTADGPDVGFEVFTYPDGQRQLKLKHGPKVLKATVEARIANADELFDVLMAKDALDAYGCRTALNVRYMLAARSDKFQPLWSRTLRVVARTIQAAGFDHVRVLDPHSVDSVGLLEAETVYPQAAQKTLDRYAPASTVVIAPDAGSAVRVGQFVKGTSFTVAYGMKVRNPETGALSGFHLADPATRVQGKTCLIMDDICDGGGTFVGLAKVLREAGALDVDLFVTHGIFSKGLPLVGIRSIYTTDSYCPRVSGLFSEVFAENMAV